MSERPNIVFATLVAIALLALGLVGVGIAALSDAGVGGVALTLVGAFTTCFFFLLELDEIPFSSLFIALVGAASAVSFARTLVRYLRERRLLRMLPLEPLADKQLAQVAREAGIRELLLLRSSRPSAFCVGLRKPSVVLTSALLATLDAEEQAAVVWHEATHARTREPLKCLVARVAARTFFWLPLLSGLLDRYLLAKELAADRRAIERTSVRALAGALISALPQPATAAVGLAEFSAARVERLLDPSSPLPRLVRPWHVVTSAATVVLVGLAAAFPANVDPAQTQQMWEMLTTLSPHGLPGMTVGLAANAALLAGVAVIARRLAR